VIYATAVNVGSEVGKGEGRKGR